MSPQSDIQQKDVTPTELISGFMTHAGRAKLQLKKYDQTLVQLSGPVRPPFYIRYTGLSGRWSEKRSQEVNRVAQERDVVLFDYMRQAMTVVSNILPNDLEVKKAVEALSRDQATLDVLVYNKESLHSTAAQFLCFSKLLQRVVQAGTPLSGRTDIACAAMSLDRSLVESAKLEETLIDNWPKDAGRNSVRPSQGALALIGDVEASSLFENLIKMQKENADTDRLSAELKQSGEGIKRLLRSASHHIKQAQEKHTQTMSCDLDDFFVAVSSGLAKVKGVDKKTMRTFLFAVTHGALSKTDAQKISPHELFILSSIKDGAVGPIGVMERAYGVAASPIVAEESLLSDTRKRLNLMRQRPLIQPLVENTTHQKGLNGLGYKQNVTLGLT